MQRLCIVAAKRTPQGRLMGALAKYPAVQLAITAARPLLEQIAPEKIDQVIVGNVIGAGQGMNVARQVGVGLATLCVGGGMGAAMVLETLLS